MSTPPLHSAPGQFPETGVGATFATSNQESAVARQWGRRHATVTVVRRSARVGADSSQSLLGAAQTGLARPLSHLAKMQQGEAEKESPDMLPVAVTAEAPTTCGGGDTPAPGTVSPRRETTGSGYGSAPPKPKKASAVKKPAAREVASTSTATAIVEAPRTSETTQVDSGVTVLFTAQQFLSRHPRAARHSPLYRTLSIRALLSHPARVQQQARSAILPVIFVPQVPS